MRSNTSRSGQSLIDVLIASGVGAILLVGALSVLAPALRGSTDAENAQDGAAAARGLMDQVRSLAASNWNALASLTPGTAYTLQSTASGSIPVAGTEGSSAVPELSGLVARYAFDDANTATAANSVSGSPSLTSAGGPTAVSTCKVNGCWGMDGNDDTATALGVPVNTTAGGKNTVSFWMKHTGTNGNFEMPFGWQEPYDLIFNPAGTCFGFNTGNGEVLGVTGAVPLNTWTHVVAVFVNGAVDNSTVDLYLNGTKQTLAPCYGGGSTSRSATSRIVVGGWGYDPNYKFTGQIDDLRIINRGVSASEATQLFGMGNSVAAPTSEANLASEWNLDDVPASSGANSVSGGPTLSASGTSATTSCQIGTGCWSFNGSGYADAALPSGLTAVQTRMAWVKPSGVGNEYIIDQGGNNNWLQAYGGHFRAGSNAGGGYWDSNLTITGNTWYHVAVTQDASNVWNMYINGVLDSTHTMTATSQPTGIRIGNYSGGGAGINGVIDDVRIYKMALSATDIARIYAKTPAATSQITRSFSVFPVRRNSSGAYVDSGGYVDSSTLKIVVTYAAPRATSKTISTFVTRSQSKALAQSDWSGGAGLTSTTSDPGSQYATSTAIDVLTKTGSVQADLANLSGSGGSGGGAAGIAAASSDHYAWNDLVGWINFYSSGNVTLSASRLRGYANSSAGEISLDCTTSPAGNICGSSTYYVTNNGLGTLAGYGWSDAYGWISFNCSNHGCGSSTYGVSVNPSTGVFSGYAWNDLVGWISFNCSDINICGTSNYKVVSDWRATSGTGSLDSAIIDTGVVGGAQVNGITWTGVRPTGTEVRLQVATSNSDSGPWTYVGPDGTAASFYNPDSGVGAALYPWVHASGRYFRYRVTLVTDVGMTLTPRVDDVVVRWSP